MHGFGKLAFIEPLLTLFGLFASGNLFGLFVSIWKSQIGLTEKKQLRENTTKQGIGLLEAMIPCKIWHAHIFFERT